jgi:predicted LPLAT superfamily acyltransferase
MDVTAPLSPPAPAPTPAARNPGPSWGFQFLRLCDRMLPEFIFYPLRAAGTAVAICGMSSQRRYSRAYLATVLPHTPTLLDVFRHFFAFEETLMLKLRVANGRAHRGVSASGDTDFASWLRTDEVALLGTFHVGDSDLLGFLLGGYARRKVYLVRLRVANSHDTEKLGTLFGEWVRFVWVNDPSEMIFALKGAIANTEGAAVAMQCDRADYSSRSEPFDFLGARRLFPFTIYYLALIFQKPVLLSVGVPGAPGESVLHSSPVFRPIADEPRAAALARARAHFQNFLHQLETLLRAEPYLWFNFTPLNLPVSP